MRLHLVLLPIFALVGCGDDDHDHDHDHPHHEDDDTDHGSETEEDQQVTIAFQATYGDQLVACGETYPGDLGSETVRFSDFRFYVSDVALLDAAGNEVPLALEPDGMWQTDRVALLDFEDGTGLCSATGNAYLRDFITGTAPAGAYTGVTFNLGIPFEVNHQDVNTAEAPLNLSSLFWNWRGGYKFVRIDLRNDQEEGWFFHLGSTGCVASDAMAAPDSPCSNPNLPRVTLLGDPLAEAVVLDARALLDGVDVGYNTPDSPPGCMANSLDVVECPPVFANLGLDWETGRCVDDCDGQIAFSLE